MNRGTDKRALTRQYKEAPPAGGVYVIRNLADPRRVYVGASLNLDGAMNRDRFELKLKGHRHPRLSEDWARCGAESFRFEVVDALKPRPDDPAFDPKAELAALFELWTEEFGREPGVTVERLSSR